jgi:hypothetical protein
MDDDEPDEEMPTRSRLAVLMERRLSNLDLLSKKPMTAIEQRHQARLKAKEEKVRLSRYAGYRLFPLDYFYLISFDRVRAMELLAATFGSQADKPPPPPARPSLVAIPPLPKVFPPPPSTPVSKPLPGKLPLIKESAGGVAFAPVVAATEQSNGAANVMKAPAAKVPWWCLMFGFWA